MMIDPSEFAWYPWALWPLALFNVIVSTIFLLRWSRRIRVNRDYAWRGLVWLAIGTIGYALRAMWGRRPGGPPLPFVNDFDAFTALWPHAAFAVAYTHWLIHNRRQDLKRSRR